MSLPRVYARGFRARLKFCFGHLNLGFGIYLEIWDFISDFPKEIIVIYF